MGERGRHPDHEQVTPEQDEERQARGGKLMRKALRAVPDATTPVRDGSTDRAVPHDASAQTAFSDGISAGIHVARSSTGGDIHAAASSAIDRASGSSGAPLPDLIRRKFEGSLGADLSDVRVHTGEASHAATSAVAARAFATGQDIHFGSGQYDPSSDGGQLLLAHEVAHTVQQRGSGTRPQFKLEVTGPGDACETEADNAASAMVAGRPTTVSGAPTSISRQVHSAGGRTALEYIQSQPVEWMAMFRDQIVSAIRRAGQASAPIDLVLQGPIPAMPRTFRVVSDDLRDLLNAVEQRALGEHRQAPAQAVAPQPAPQPQPAPDRAPHAPRSGGGPDEIGDVHEARQLIGTGRRADAEAYLLQLRAARHRSIGVEGHVQITLQGEAPTRGRTFEVSTDDIPELEQAAADRMRAVREDHSESTAVAFPEPAPAHGARPATGPLAAEVYTSEQTIAPPRATAMPQGDDRTRLERLADQLLAAIPAWMTFRNHPAGTPPGAEVFAAVEVLSGQIDDSVAGPFLLHRIGANARNVLGEMIAFNGGAGAVRLQRLLEISYGRPIPAGHRYRISMQGWSVRGGANGTAVGISVRAATLTYDNAFGMHYVQPLRAVNISLSAGISLAAIVEAFGGGQGGAGGSGERELTSTDGTATDYAWFVPGPEFHGTFLMSSLAYGTSTGSYGGATTTSQSVGNLEVMLPHGSMRFLLDPSTNRSVTYGRGRDRPGASSGLDASVGVEAGVGRIYSTGPQHSDPPVPPVRNVHPELVETGHQELLTSEIYFAVGHADIPSGGDSAISDVVRTVDRFIIDHPGSAEAIDIAVNAYASPRWNQHADDATAAGDENYQLSVRRARAVQTRLGAAILERSTGGACQRSDETCEATPVTPNRGSSQGSTPALRSGVQMTEAPAYWHRVQIVVRAPTYRHSQVANEPQRDGH